MLWYLFLLALLILKAGADENNSDQSGPKS